MKKSRVVTKLNQLERQIIVHSFIYYLYDESIWSDDKFDKVCKRMAHFIKRCPKAFKKSQFYNRFKDFDGTTGHHLIKKHKGKYKGYYNKFASLAYRLINY